MTTVRALNRQKLSRDYHSKIHREKLKNTKNLCLVGILSFLITRKMEIVLFYASILAMLHFIINTYCLFRRKLADSADAIIQNYHHKQPWACSLCLASYTLHTSPTRFFNICFCPF